MTKKDLQRYTLNPQMTLLEAASVIVANASRCAFVLSEGKVIGTLSEGDILKALLKNVSPYAPIETCINHSFKFLTKRSNEDALKLIREHAITLIPVVDKNMTLKDIITLKEALEKLP